MPPPVETGRLRRGPLLLAAGAWATAAAVRAFLLTGQELGFGACDAFGLARDGAAAVAMVAVALLARRLARAAAVAIVVLWGLLSWAQLEHVLALDAPLRWENIGYLADPTFLLGSAAAVRHPVGLAAVLVALASLAGVTLRRAPDRRTLVGWGAAALVASAAALLPLPDPGCLEWRASHPFFPRIGGASTDPAVDGTAVVAALAPDLAGDPRWTAPPATPRPNVLLVLLEGAGAASLPTVAARHGLPAPLAMPKLDAIARDNLLATTFFYQQRQTNRGEYAVLCGDLPELASRPPRFGQLATPWPHPCLPELLAENGWRTVYLQAAPLGFMAKDQALPRAGFQEVRGDESFAEARLRSRWGVDDHTFFHGALARIAELRRAEGPWMLTLLNVGTHHPFTVPEAVPGVPAGAGPVETAFLHLDHAFAGFWNELARRGWLDDTLVVVTGDESWGTRSGPALTRELSQNLGFAIVRPPGGVAPGFVEEPYAQSDLALTVVDALGLDGPDLPFTGRSLRRAEPAPRPLYFANVYLHRAYALLPGGRLLACAEGGTECRAWQVDSRAILRNPPEPVVPSRAETDLLASAVAYSLRRPGGALPSRRQIALVADPSVPVPPSGSRFAFGGQSFEVAAGEAVTVELEVRATGSGGWIGLRHDLVVDEERVYVPRLPPLPAGGVARLRYRWVADRAATVSTQLQVDRLVPGEISLTLPVARVTIAPAEGAPAGLAVEREAVERPVEPPPIRLDAANLAPQEVASCLGRAPGGTLAGRCDAGLLLTGPRFIAPWGSRISVRVPFRTGGPGRARLLVGSERAGIVVLEGAPSKVDPGGSAELTLEGTVEAILPELQVALEWAPAAGPTDVEIGGVEVVLKMP